TADGQVDRYHLQETPYLDTHQTAALERQIKKEPGIEKAAIEIEENREKPEVLYIKDYLTHHDGSAIKETAPKPGDKQHKKEGGGTPALVHGPQWAVPKENEPATLVEILERAVKENGEKGIVYIHAEAPDEIHNYTALLEEAGKILAGLRQKGLKPGDKALFQFNNNKNFINAFWACV
ncbi:MAG: hypothetical protein GY757_43055, partial [bacterium]|nr:hypothetical protein [bacterium]